jgi:hypothetical protein
MALFSHVLPTFLLFIHMTMNALLGCFPRDMYTLLHLAQLHCRAAHIEPSEPWTLPAVQSHQRTASANAELMRRRRSRLSSSPTEKRTMVSRSP